MLFRDPVRLRAGAIRLIRQIEKRADRIEIEAQLACMANKGEPANRSVIVHSSIARGPWRRRQQTGLFVKAARRNLHARRGGELADGEKSGGRHERKNRRLIL